MITVERKRALYQTLMNHWQVIADENTIIEMQVFCEMNKFNYESLSKNEIELIY